LMSSTTVRRKLKFNNNLTDQQKTDRKSRFSTFTKTGFYEFRNELNKMDQARKEVLFNAFVSSLDTELAEMITESLNNEENDEENDELMLFGLDENTPCLNVVVKILKHEREKQPCETLQKIIKQKNIDKMPCEKLQTIIRKKDKQQMPCEKLQQLIKNSDKDEMPCKNILFNIEKNNIPRMPCIESIKYIID